MKRRNLLRTLGAASVATVGVAGTASAARSRVAADVGIDLPDIEVDVADVDGTVPLASVLDDDQIRDLPDDVDPDRETIWVSQDVDVFALPSCCCTCDPDCFCCTDLGNCGED